MPAKDRASTSCQLPAPARGCSAPSLSIVVFGAHALVDDDVLRVDLTLVEDDKLSVCASALLAVTKHCMMRPLCQDSVHDVLHIRLDLVGVIEVAARNAAHDQGKQARKYALLVVVRVLVPFAARLCEVQAVAIQGAGVRTGQVQREVLVADGLHRRRLRAMKEVELVNILHELRPLQNRASAGGVFGASLRDVGRARLVTPKLRRELLTEPEVLAPLLRVLVPLHMDDLESLHFACALVEARIPGPLVFPSLVQHLLHGSDDGLRLVLEEHSALRLGGPVLRVLDRQVRLAPPVAGPRHDRELVELPARAREAAPPARGAGADAHGLPARAALHRHLRRGRGAWVGGGAGALGLWSVEVVRLGTVRALHLAWAAARRELRFEGVWTIPALDARHGGARLLAVLGNVHPARGLAMRAIECDAALPVRHLDPHLLHASTTGHL
mmetsp:Transcript_49418/g.139046  ORF Transcript_49418/g.139046 Transcript_49418/m.139046 type:complete len:442 (-) Transcript_49418:392-1717(-)